jgi:hypothetical protein
MSVERAAISGEQEELYLLAELSEREEREAIAASSASRHLDEAAPNHEAEHVANIVGAHS